jgi:hypothetical protein
MLGGRSQSQGLPMVRFMPRIGKSTQTEGRFQLSRTRGHVVTRCPFVPLREDGQS